MPQDLKTYDFFHEIQYNTLLLNRNLKVQTKSLKYRDLYYLVEFPFIPGPQRQACTSSYPLC